MKGLYVRSDVYRVSVKNYDLKKLLNLLDTSMIY